MTKGEQTRQAIIEKAAPLFNQRGFVGCSMAEIMAVTGLEKGGLYRHFESKEDLAAEVLRYSLQRAVHDRGLFDPIPGDAVTQLLELIHRFVSAPSPVPGGCPLLNSAIDADDGNPALRRIARSALAIWKKRIADIVEQGIAAGDLLRSTSPEQIANLIISTLEGALMISRLERDRRPLQDAQASLNILLASLEPREDASGTQKA